METLLSTTMETVKQQQQQSQQQQQKQDVEKVFHVLAVDDSRIERKILEKLLTISSFQVTSVESGDKALEYLGLLHDNPHPSASSRQQGHGMNVNLIMTDYSMPGMSGYDLLKRVKGSYWKDVPVIVMSSENVPSRINMCLEEGAEEFLLKPVRLSDLKNLQYYVEKSLNKADDSKIEFGSSGGDKISCKDEEKSLRDGFSFNQDIHS